MSKTGSDELYTLIKALNKAEKAHFGKMALAYSKDKKALHFKLYELLCKQKDYNEEKLLIGLKPISKVNFSGLKKYLYAQIIKSLNDYHDRLDVHTEIERHLHTIRIFLSKNLLEHADNVLNKVKSIAIKSQDYNYLLAITFLEYQMRMRDLRTDSYVKYEFENQKTHIAQIQNILEYRKISLPIYSYMMMDGGNSMTEAEIRNVKQLFQNPLLQGSNRATNHKSLIEYYRIRVFCSMLLNKIDGTTVQIQKECINYLESDAAKLVDRNNAYLSSLSLMMAIFLRLKNINITEFEEYYNKAILFVKSLPAYKKSKSDLSMLSVVVGNYMAGLIRWGEPQKAIDALKTYKSLKVTSENIENTLINNLHMIAAHILLNKFKEALKYVDQLINSKYKFRLDVQIISRFYELIIHYELRNPELLPYKAKSTERYLIKHNEKISEFSKIILFYFKNILPNINRKNDEQEVFTNMKNDLLKATKDVAHSENEVLDWIESKILKLPLAEIKKISP